MTGLRGGGGRGSPPVPQASSSLPSMQSASASQRQRRGMQWPLLHWNWSMSQRGVQSFCGHRSGHPGQIGAPLQSRPDPPEATPPSAGPPPHLVGAICAVMVPIAFPAPSDAAAVGTGELTLGAGPRGWRRTGERQAPGGWAQGLSPRGFSSPWQSDTTHPCVPESHR